jgi:hypothetical protein
VIEAEVIRFPLSVSAHQRKNISHGLLKIDEVSTLQGSQPVSVVGYCYAGKL